MAIFYRGAGVGTYWHEKDARTSGFTPKSGGTQHNVDRLMQHVARANVDSPYISLTRSYGVAYNYAIMGRTVPSEDTPAYVYEIVISDPIPEGLELLDPIQEVARAAPRPPASISYQHDGDINFILGVVSPSKMEDFLTKPIKQPPRGEGTPRPANLSIELETLARALRDAEILAVGNIPSSCVQSRHAILE